jgi:PAS domain S-box-containing protein
MTAQVILSSESAAASAATAGPATDAGGSRGGADGAVPLRWRLLWLALAPALASGVAFHLLARNDAGPGATLLAAAGMLAAIVVLSRGHARTLRRPLLRLIEQSRALTARYSGVIPAADRCEMATLAKSVDAMTTALIREAEDARHAYRAEARTSHDLQRQYALMQMLRNLACVANQCGSLEAALRSSLEEIGAYLDWPIGRLLVVRGRGDGVSEEIVSHWHVPGNDQPGGHANGPAGAPAKGRFAALMAECGRAPADCARTGLVGRARESNLAHWITDLERLEDWPLRAAARDCGLRTGFVIPVAATPQTMAFVEFFSDHRIEASAEMLELVEAISVELWRTASGVTVPGGSVAAAARAERLASIAESMAGAVALIAADGRVEWVNEGLTRLVERDTDECVGREAHELLFGANPPSAEAFRRHVESGAPVCGVVLPAQAAGAEAKWVELEIQPMPDRGRGPAGSCLIVRDITRERATQAALSEALAFARQASQSKPQFLANMSHEIRTPMNGVLGMAELLLGTGLDERQRRYIESLLRAGEELREIVNDILDFSKIEAGKLELERIDFDLRPLVDDLIALLAPRAHQKNIRLECRISSALPRTVRGDPTRLRQVLVNIVGNAIKFTERGEVVLTVEATPDPGAEAPSEEATRVRFTVRDTGIGMQPEVLERPFTVFMQADQTSSRRCGGTGLGLAICRQLTELMNGRIWATSVPGAGSVFHFEVPLLHGAPAAAVPAPVELSALAGLRVLVVEDNAVNQEVVGAMLAEFGCSVQMAGDGASALERIAEEDFDVVLMDCQMPVLDGFETMRRLRAAQSRPGGARGADRPMPVIALTAYALPADARRCRDAGFSDHLAKPFRQRELGEMLLRWTAGHARASGCNGASAATAPMPHKGDSSETRWIQDSVAQRTG